ncbi:B12D protein [Rhynchospora pubera]|nr:B12D protein [Rhynchospora pubera]KAJ4809595.1 B12D protein [Rhynchospora pubera]
MASSSLKRWLRPEVYPLFASVGVAVGICGMQLTRNITGNPDVRVTKEKRGAGVLDNFAEGQKYKDHGVRKYVLTKKPEIMPSVNHFFSKPE